MSRRAAGTPSYPARLVVADDHAIARAGLRSMLAAEPGLEVVGEAASGREALALCKRLQPDLILMDVRMPELDGLRATRAIRQECPGCRVVLISMYESAAYLAEAFRAGASGYVLKDASQTQVINTVRRVLRGESLLDSRTRSASSNQIREQPMHYAAPSPETLTARELEVLQLLAQGKTNPEIAGLLGIKRGTAKVHVERILSKLGAADRTHAAVRAVELGLVKPTTG